MKLLNKPKKEKKGKKEKQKKWKEKDKKTLLERVKDKYLAIKKLRFNLIKVNPMIAETKRYEKELKRMPAQASLMKRYSNNKLFIDAIKSTP